MLEVWNLRVQALYYFDATLESTLTLDSHLRFRRVTKREKYSYGNLSEPDHGLGWGLEGPLSFVIECVLPTEDQTRSTIRRLAISLLLFKPDRQGRELAWFRLGLGGSRLWKYDKLPVVNASEFDREKMRFPGYRLNGTDFYDFPQFWSICNQSEWHPSFLIAGGRLLLAQARTGENVFEDRLIDLMIACEALVLTGEEDKAKLIGRRAGRLQGQQVPELEKRATDSLKLAYSLRNDIVHEGQLSASKLNLLPCRLFEEFVPEVEQYLRLAMVNYLHLMNQGMSKDQIIQQLDSS